MFLLWPSMILAVIKVAWDCMAIFQPALQPACYLLPICLCCELPWYESQRRH